MKRYFEWDDKKAASNLRKHGVAFEEAALVFKDPLCASKPERIENGQERWRTIGLSEEGLLLYVAHTLRVEETKQETAEIIRIISARRATKSERKAYEHG